MMLTKLGRDLLRWGFVVAGIILVSVGWLSYRSATRFAEAAERPKHTYQVLQALDDTVGRLVDAETGQRGYLLTGDESYLEPYRQAIKNLDQVTGRLKELTFDSPIQQQRIEVMDVLIDKKLAELDRTIELRRKDGSAAATKVVLEGSGKAWMDQIRVIAAEMANDENNLLRIRTDKANESMAASARTIAGGTIGSVALLMICFGMLSRELTERKRAQAALTRSEMWLSTTLGSIGDAVIATDTNGAVNFMNSVAQSLTGWKQEQAWGKSMDLVFDIVNKETRRPVENPVKKVFREGKVVGLANHTILISKNGAEFDIEDSAAPIITRDGESLGVVLVFRDITEKKLAEEETKRQKELLQLILESIADGVVVADSNGKFLLFNAAAEQVLGIGATDTTPDQWSDQYGSYLPDGVTVYPPSELPLVRAMRGESFSEVEVFIRNAKVPDGRLISITGGPLRGEDGILRGGVIGFRDITMQKNAQAALLRAKEEAERSNRFKDQFLSTMSHELRTPLNAVLGFSDLLSEARYGPLNERQLRYVTHIHTGGQHLLRLINDILDLSKIEAGRLELAIENVPVERTLREVLDAVRPLAEKKSHTLTCEAESSLGVRADGTRLKQILINLVGNAIKFTPYGGHIKVAGHLVDGTVRLEVSDNGPGIPPEEKKRIFEAFYRLRQSGITQEGTGLGLAITQRLVELHGSELGLESQPGHGSCFYFSLPFVQAYSAVPASAIESREREGGIPRIFIIEDDSAAAQLIQSQLASSGYEALLCEELSRVVEIAAELQPDAITLDLLMKPTNGWELLLQLKNEPRTANIPVIVISIVDQPALGTTLGADEYLVKPVDQSALLAAIERCLAAKEGLRLARPVLVVEDDSATREVLTELLSSQGYATATASDGAQARAWMNDSLPAFVILDLMLPNVSGFELLSEWRGSPRTADLPVFVLTSKDLTREEERYLRTHAESLSRKQEYWQQSLTKEIRRVLAPIQLAGK
ncbi:MAG TPA: CHASE3 domain-containing protein [Candidatus Acidoferrales bacterium]